MSTLPAIVESPPLAGGKSIEIQQAIVATVAEIAVTDAKLLGRQHAPTKSNKGHSVLTTRLRHRVGDTIHTVLYATLVVAAVQGFLGG